MTVRFGNLQDGVSLAGAAGGGPIAGSSGLGGGSSGVGSVGQFGFSWEHPVAWAQLRKYFEKSIGEEESKKLISILESNAKSLEDFLDAAYLKANGGTVFGPTNFTAGLNVSGYINVPPPGVIVQFAGSNSPAGWLMANGTQQPIAAYTSLYNTITNGGTVFPYGPNTNGFSGAGSTHFRLPNLIGRVPVGIDPGQPEFDVLGKTGGNKTHTLTTAQLPAHTHTVFAISSNPASFPSPFGLGMTTLTTSDADKPTGSTGSGDPHNNLQPYIVLNYIIKH